MRHMKHALAVSLITIACQPALAQEFRAQALVFDVTMEPKGIMDTTAECLNHSRCSSALRSLASYVGVPPNAVDFATVLAGLTYQPDGETTRYDLHTNSGYQTCRISIDVLSTTPADGSSASLLDVAVHPNRVHLVSWTPTQNMGGGRSWVDARITLLEVRDDVAQSYRNNGGCHPTADRVWVYRCRGKSGDGDGRQPCGSYRG